MTEFSFIMPCYLIDPSLVELTREAIHSFRKAEPDAEIVIVDDGSKFGSGFLKNEADVYVRFQKNQGFIKAVNAGMQIANSFYLAICNNDIRVAPNIFKVACEILKDGSIYSVHPRMTLYDVPFEYGEQVVKTGKERWCQTSCFVVRGVPGVFAFPDFFEGTGGAYEDWYYWSIVRMRGWKTAYTDETCFQHKDSSTTQLVGEGKKEHEMNRQLFKMTLGEYPEDYYFKLYPNQMTASWRGGFEL